MAALLEAWTDSGVHRSENMSSTSIGPELDNNENEIEKPEVYNIEEEQDFFLEQPKVDEVEEYHASFPSNK